MVDTGASHVGQADGIYDDAGPVPGEEHIIFCGRRDAPIEGKVIGEPVTAARLYGEPQIALLIVEDLPQPLQTQGWRWDRDML